MTAGPSSSCAFTAAEPSLGSCTRMTFGGTSGTVVSMRSLPAAAAAISAQRLLVRAAYGTVTTRISPRAAASAFAPEATLAPNSRLSVAAVA